MAIIYFLRSPDICKNQSRKRHYANGGNHEQIHTGRNIVNHGSACHRSQIGLFVPAWREFAVDPSEEAQGYYKYCACRYQRVLSD